MPRRVVITGLGAVSPCGLDVPTTWASMLSRRSGIGPVTRFDTSGWRTRIAGEVRGFDAEARFGKKDVRRLGRFQQFALAAAEEALNDAAFSTPPDPDRFGVYVGTGIGGFPEIVETAIDADRDGQKAISPLFIPRSLNNLAAGLLAIRHNARGPSLCLSTACAVGNHSIGEAWRAILWDDADVMLAGGTEAALTPIGLGGFMNMKATSARNGEPERASRPFDRGRDGFVMSEGAGLVVLESLDHALRRNARIYCELTGYAVTTDAHHVTAPSPEGEGAARCMARALTVAKLRPEDVDYLNAHGTSTPMNDQTESLAIRTVFGDHDLYVSSTKGVTGHLLGAAGGVEAVATALAVHHGILPPTANLDDPDPECRVRHVVEPVRMKVRAALSNGFGFGGTNATLVFSAWEGA